MKPNPKNFCGGNFQDWLEVNLTPHCNGKCSWCVEKRGFHPRGLASYYVLFEQILASKKSNVILLGGEPTLYQDLPLLISALNNNQINIYITTNASNIELDCLTRIKGLNLSIHHYNLNINKEIVGVNVSNNKEEMLKEQIYWLKSHGVSIRLNCNCIKGYIDNKEKILKYIEFGKRLGANKIRFAELKFEEENFIDLAKEFNYAYGLNDNPFVYGCNHDAIINDMPINFRQMCGFQTNKRVCPPKPEVIKKQVLYYDGKIYNGWQTESKMGIKKILKDLLDGKITIEQAEALIKAQQSPPSDEKPMETYESFCQY